jgi:DNA-binding Lrp family transcriptional regulator
LKDANLKLIRELIRNSRKSDRELAKLIGVSQPTVSRNRKRLEKEGFIEYTGIPNLEKLGFEIIAITLGNWKHEQYPDTRISAAKDFAKKHPNLIFLSSGRGLNSDRVAVSVHKNYSDYAKFMLEVRTDWGKFMEITGSFLISISSDEPLRSITFKYLADYLEKEKSE